MRLYEGGMLVCEGMNPKVDITKPGAHAKAVKAEDGFHKKSKNPGIGNPTNHRPGDVCYKYSAGILTFVTLDSMKEIAGEFQTYNISCLKNNNNYFANGILVNNEKKNSSLLNANSKK